MTRSKRIVIEERRWAVRMEWISGGTEVFCASADDAGADQTLEYATYRTRRQARERATRARRIWDKARVVRCTVRLIVEG